MPVGDAKELARAIRDVVDDRAQARRWGEAGRARVESHFRAGEMVDRFARLYEEVAAAKGLSR